MEKNKETKQIEEKELGITADKDKDFSEWYTQLVARAELADIRYNIKGFIVYREWSTITIKKMYDVFERLLEKRGHKPLIMPSLIPESNFVLEKEHVKGFAPEVFWVTEHGAGEEFEERYALRPTSETAFYQMYALWIRSYKDLPFKRYQSCQVWRYEGKATRPFFRAREFHWIEAHDAFATLKDAEAQIKEDMQITKEALLDAFAIPFIFFQRPQWDKFAGAINTYAADALMPNGRVMQLPSTHLLGQNFSKPFNVTFTDKDGQQKLCYITCYGPAISRIYGALISIHGDNKGLVLPFDMAPVQVVILPVINKKSDGIVEEANKLKEKLQEYSVEVDERDDLTLGFKFNEWELKGVPVRIEIGPRDIKEHQVIVFRRDLNSKKPVKIKDLEKEIKEIQHTFTSNLRKKAGSYFEKNLATPKTIDELKSAIQDQKICKVNFCSIDKDGEECAAVVEKDVSAFVRGKRMDKDERPTGNCIVCGRKAHVVTYIAKSY